MLKLLRFISPSESPSHDPNPIQPSIPPSQTVLLLRGPRQQYDLVQDYPVPEILHENEVLVKTRIIGLNPIDWKAPDFGFGIPELPCISGRELTGDIIRTGNRISKLHINERVLAISTDYRDVRKGAYQEYVIALDYNIVRLPPTVSYEEGSTLGVAFVAAALALGVSLGLDFSHVLGGPNLFTLVRDIGAAKIPQDVVAESLEGIGEEERLKRGEWLAIWGGSATSANLTIQLAKLAGVKVIVVVDKAKHGLRISNHPAIRPDLLIDSHDPERAVQIIKANTQGQLRFGLDTRGRESATHLLGALTQHGDSNNLSPSRCDGLEDRDTAPRAHLIGMSGLPKASTSGDVYLHTVPIKLFHDVPAVGAALCRWLERLLHNNRILPPDIIDVELGLNSINAGLNRMRSGHISGGKLVVRV